MSKGLFVLRKVVFLMGDWLLAPAKVFLTGLLIAAMVTFGWRAVEINAVHEAAVNAAHSAVANPANYQVAAKGAVNVALPNAQLQSVQQVAPDVTAATVSYQPPDTYSAVFRYLGVPDPNQPITMTGTAPGGLADLALTVPNMKLGAGQSFVVSGSLKDGAGNPISNKTITMSDSGGSLSQSTFTTDSNGDFSTQYTTPDTLGTVSITASGDGANTSITVNIVDNVTFNSLPTTYVGQTVTISGMVSPVSSPQQVTFVATTGNFSGGG